MPCEGFACLRKAWVAVGVTGGAGLCFDGADDAFEVDVADGAVFAFVDPRDAAGPVGG